MPWTDIIGEKLLAHVKNLIENKYCQNCPLRRNVKKVGDILTTAQVPSDYVIVYPPAVFFHNENKEKLDYLILILAKNPVIKRENTLRNLYNQLYNEFYSKYLRKMQYSKEALKEYIRLQKNFKHDYFNPLDMFILSLHNFVNKICKSESICLISSDIIYCDFKNMKQQDILEASQVSSIRCIYHFLGEFLGKIVDELKLNRVYVWMVLYEGYKLITIYKQLQKKYKFLELIGCSRLTKRRTWDLIVRNEIRDSSIFS